MRNKSNKKDSRQILIEGYERLPDYLPMISQDVNKNNLKKSSDKDTSISHNINIGDIETVIIDTQKSKISPSIITTAPYNGRSKFIQTIHNNEMAKQAAQQATLKDYMKHPYVRKNIFLTNAEKKLFIFLQERMNYLSNKLSIALNHNIGSIVILSKVRLADIVQVNAAINKQNYFLNKIAYKHIDFVILSASPALDIICTVELDDYTHNSPDRQRRDNFVNEVLRDCGVKLYRIGVKIDNITPQYTRGIETAVLEYYAPKCPVCGKPMESKESTRSRNYGHRFYGCIGWYESGSDYCGYTIDID